MAGAASGARRRNHWGPRLAFVLLAVAGLHIPNGVNVYFTANGETGVRDSGNYV